MTVREPRPTLRSVMNRPMISALIHTRNETRWIAGCVRSVLWADEIVVADMCSTDDTREIATSMGARIVEMPLAENVDMVRNQALAACKGDWILVVDADETVSPGLAARLRDLSATPTAEAYALPRRNYFYGEWVEHIFWPDHQVRFFRRGAAFWDGVIHHPPEIRGRLEALPAVPECALEHPGYCNDIHRFMLKLVHYSRLEVERMRELKPEAWPFLVRRPVSEFVGRYFGGGWRHGLSGLVLSLILAMYQLFIGLQYWEAVWRNAAAPAPSALRRGVRREVWRTACKMIFQ